jgi:hypothetical protein
VGRLDAAGRQRFHEEQMLAAEMVLLPRDRIPPTVEELRAYIEDVVATGVLWVTDAARERRATVRGTSARSGVASRPQGRVPLGVRDAPDAASRRLRRPLVTGEGARASGLASVGPSPAPAPSAEVPVHRALPGVAGRGRGTPRREPDASGVARRLLLDIDGVLTMSWEEIPGASAVVEELRRRGIPFRLLTNTTTHTRTELARTLEGSGILRRARGDRDRPWWAPRRTSGRGIPARAASSSLTVTRPRTSRVSSSCTTIRTSC